MAIQLQGNAGVVAEVDASPHRAMRVTIRPSDIGALGSYRLTATSGLVTTVAAASATAGHLFAFRWGSSTNVAVIKYIDVQVRTIAGYTAAQEVGFDLVVARGYTASHTSGTGLTLTGNAFKKRSSMATTSLTDARISTTGALTAGTHTLDAVAMLSDQYAELAAGAAVAKGRYGAIWDMGTAADYPLILSQDTGLVVRNSILQGAGGTARLNVTVAWDEFANANF